MKSKKVEVASGYKENEILNAKPEELTLMLYDGIIRFIKQAKIFNEDKKIEKTNNAIVRAQNIITELRSTLDMDYEISKELDPLYEFMNRRLLEANIKKDNAMMDEVLDLAAELRDTWKEAMKIAKKV
ncbi:MAG: flagellar export chaperone FliS [Firmicutes bacterium]|nr:flagellar export chaperone FliS [Bacillota bacterium]